MGADGVVLYALDPAMWETFSVLIFAEIFAQSDGANKVLLEAFVLLVLRDVGPFTEDVVFIPRPTALLKCRQKFDE